MSPRPRKEKPKERDPVSIPCKYCFRDIEPDPMYSSYGRQDWTMWVHSYPTYTRACATEADPPTRAEPEDWVEAMALWIG